jgi:hypothetical protein
LLTLPPAAVTVNVAAPTVAVDPAVNVTVLEPLPGEAMLVGAKVAVTPLGSPLIEKAMAELNPVPAAAVNLTETEAPRATLAVARLDESVNVPVTFKLSA